MAGTDPARQTELCAQAAIQIQSASLLQGNEDRERPNAAAATKEPEKWEDTRKMLERQDVSADHEEVEIQGGTTSGK
ncbi:hypothetical protein NDU88_006027 [Pleurodeles waltl]|uniref:Uncharacterized protein n=1 Tax=Pleurodeles waltl TaxID=8319 RepID=A0AAV7MEP6_PLEWA|nr:hypothetical protein NDU88_006027 [Pleurodeles waltl]